MFSSVLFRFSKPNSCLVLLSFLFYFHLLPCALSQREDRLCDALFRCGNLTAGFPFWGVARPEPCGHPSLVLHCHDNKTSLIISGQMYRILQIDNSFNTLRLARQDILNGSFCDSTFTSTTLTPELFELLPDYKILFVHYVCDPLYHNPANFTCPTIGVASLHQDNNYQEHCGASFNITVPTSYAPDKHALNLTHLGSVLRNGYKVKLKIDERPCQECQSSGGICAYDVATPVCCKITNSSSESKCTPMIPSGSSVDELHSRCAHPFTCSNQRELNYPFWTSSREECGHPDFKVDCSGDFPEFNISSVKFQILEMNYYEDVIRLSRMDYSYNLCPQHPENAIINQKILPFVEDTELRTFYYNCSGPSLDVQLPNGYIKELECDEEIGGKSYIVSFPSHPENKAVLDELSASCQRNVTIPVSRSAMKITERTKSLEAIKRALNEGFKLRFNSDCSQCFASEGACGHNESSTAFICHCIDGPHEHTCPPEIVHKTLSRKAKIGIGFACGFLGATFFTGCLLCFMIRERGPSHHLRHHNLKALVEMKQYSYPEVKRITKSFSHTVGKGGFGTVYGGHLCDGRKVAVKILKDFKSNGEDFINEVASMSQTSHVNIVSLLGFCYEGSKRAIVYEFLENGSLDQFLSKNNSLNLDVSTLYRIALGVARGLEYLHHGCKTRIVHFDIKPQNILLDDDLCPKVSDFGLAKLCEKRESILSLLDARGTIGYIAPEVFSGMYGRVSHKSDVYSYGMLVLEMIGAKNNETMETAASNSLLSRLDL